MRNLINQCNRLLPVLSPIEWGTISAVTMIIIVLVGYAVGLIPFSRKEAKFTVKRDPEAAKYADWTSASQWMIYSELDYEMAKEEFPEVNVLSLGEYIASIQTEGTFPLSKVVGTIMQEHGVGIAIPLLFFAPLRWRKTELKSVFADVPFMELMVSNISSPLAGIAANQSLQKHQIAKHQFELYMIEKAKNKSLGNKNCCDNRVIKPPCDIDAEAIAETMAAVIPDDLMPFKGTKEFPMSNLLSSFPECHIPAECITAIDLMVLGIKNPCISVPLKEFKMFTFPDDIACVAGRPLTDIGKSAPSGKSPEPKPVHWLFPDLHAGNGGLDKICSEDQGLLNQIMGSILNRLTANALVGLNISDRVPVEIFKVRIGDKMASSLEEFCDVLKELNHEIRIDIVTNFTSFGAGLCVENRNENEGSKWTQIPLIYPVSVGVFARDPKTKEEISVTTLMQHGGINLTISGPLLNMKADWCLGIDGTTGWGGVSHVYFPWVQKPSLKKRHMESELSAPNIYKKVMRLITASAVCLNYAASEGHGLSLGGYGFLGVCVDSVAAIQHALFGKCTLYPLLLGGEAKMRLLDVYHRIQLLGEQTDKACTGWKYNAELKLLKQSIMALPCDGIVEPNAVISTVERALSSLPERSVFKAVNKCRESMQRAIDMAKASI